MATRRALITVLAALAWVAFGMALVPREAAAAPGDISVVVESDRGYYPTALAVDAAGNMYFADWNTNQVFMLVPATGQITRVAGNGAQDYSGDGGPATEASLNYPNALAVDAGGNLYISDGWNSRVRKVDAATGRISTVAGNGNWIFTGNIGDGGLATDAQVFLDIPPSGGLAFDGAGNLYISAGNPGINGNRGWLRKVDAATGLISTAATTAVWYNASPLAGDGAGNLYFVDWALTTATGFEDSGPQLIRKLDTATGATSTVTEVSTPFTAWWDGQQHYYPIPVYGMAVDNAGNLYYSTDESYKVYKVVLSSGVKTELPVGAYNSAYKGYLPLNQAYDLAVNRAGDLYIADTWDGRILKIEGNSAPPANQPPVANNDAAATDEDAAVTIAVLANDSDPDGDALTLTGVTSPGHGAAAINPDGTLTYTPNPDFNGTDTFTYTISDGQGGTATASVQVTVNPVNDVPSFTKSPDHRSIEDGGPQVIPNWAYALSKGPADEAWQALAFLVSNNNPGLFSAQPAIDPSGRLTYTAAADANGFATVTVQLRDNGGTANGGVDTSAPQTFKIEVIPVNDAPSFVKGADQAVAEDAGPQSVASWATNISAGPPDEAGQVLSFLVSNDNNGLFSAQPAVNAAGTLTYTPAANANGTANVTVQLHDNGGLFIPGCCSGGVDTSAPQTFAITVKRVADTTPPVVSLNGDASVTVECHLGTYTEAGATALDARDGNLPVASSGTVDVNTVGTYTLTYSATDHSGNAGNTVTRTVTVVDTTPPVVSLSGPGTVTVECHLGTYTEAGATALDACDGNLPVATSGSVDVTTVGTYTLSYSATDSHGNSASAIRTVTVVDTTPPVVTLNGPSEITLECHVDTYTETATATDACDGGLTLTITGSVNPQVEGTYPLTYTATDSHGNSASATRTVHVADTQGPTIALLGDPEITVECHLGTYVEKGATASDVCDGDLSDAIVIIGSVNTTAVNNYTLTYTVSDGAHHSASITRLVHVVDTTPPVVTLVGPAAVNAECHVAYTDAGATASDGCDPAPALSVTSTVNSNQLGVYTVTYIATDASGNASAPVSRTVTVVDTTPPVVALSGANPLTLECPAPYVEAGATASDACDLHPVLSIAGSVDTHTPGTYTLTYSAQDASGNVSLPVTRTVITRDTTPPTASAALTAISRDRDEDENEDGNFYRISATATDACDAHPVVSALITQPLTSTTPMVVSYKRAPKNRIQLQVEKKKLLVKLEGPSESALRALWTQVLGAGGFAVSDGQQVQLVLKKDKTEYEAQYRLDKDLKLTSAKGPGLKLVVWAVDASGNRSANAEVVPAKSGRDDRLSKLVADVQPTGFALNQNYPNPFNPSTTISYDLAEAAPVRLTIYNVMGQQVRELVAQVQEPGRYSVEWDGRDGSGQLVANGLYLYRLQAGDRVAVQKMLFAK